MNRTLFEACQYGDLDHVRQLLQTQSPDQSVAEESCLCVASRCGHVEIASLLLEHGALQTPDGRGQTPLFIASGKTSSAMVELLLNHGATMDATTCETTPLMEACCFGTLENVELLVGHGADINERHSQFGYSPIICAAVFRQIDVVNYLLMTGADPFCSDNVRSLLMCWLICVERRDCDGLLSESE